MKVSWNWLCELLDIPTGISPQAVAERLSVSGVPSMPFIRLARV